MSYRVTIEEERYNSDTKATEYKTTHTAEMPDKPTLASVLRGIADRLDPPKVSY